MLDPRPPDFASLREWCLHMDALLMRLCAAVLDRDAPYHLQRDVRTALEIYKEETENL